jgi:hypothetical protein
LPYITNKSLWMDSLVNMIALIYFFFVQEPKPVLNFYGILELNRAYLEHFVMA